MDEEDFYQGIPPELRQFRDVPILGGLESIYAEYLSPTRFPVITPRSQSTYEDMGVVYPGETVEGTYGEAEAALPPIVQSGIDFYRQFIEDPGDTAESFVEAVKQIPSQQLAAGIAATQGFEGVKDADTGQISTIDPFLVTGSGALALGTAKSIARTAGDGGTVLGIMGGRRSKTGAAREKTALSLRAMGKSADDIFRSVKGYFDDAIFGAPTSSMSSGQEGFRFEIPTRNSSLRSETVGMKNIDYGSGEAFGLDDSYRKGVFIENGALVTLGGRALTLEEVVDFPELFDEYPQLRDIEVIRLTANEGESPFDVPTAAYVNASESPSGKPMIAIKDLDNAKEFQSVVFHEVQHAVQDIEGFPRGASAAQIYEMLEERFPEAAAKNPLALKLYAVQAYETVYGEGEARAVQRRFENPEEALLNPVDSLRREISERETAMNELDVVDRVEDIDEALEPYVFVVEKGIGPFGPLLGGGQESRKPGPVTIRSLGGGSGGIRGLAHGSKYMGMDVKVPDNLEDLIFGDSKRGPDSFGRNRPPLAAPVDKYTIDPSRIADLASREKVDVTELLENFGFSNRIRDAFGQGPAASAEKGRPGFSIGTDASVSYRDFTGRGNDNYVPRIERMLAVEPQKKGYKATGKFDDQTGEPIYKYKDITMQDVEDLSPAAYLVTAYNPEKPFSKKPNSEYIESEIHIHEDLSHGMKPRQLTQRERQDVLANAEYELKALTALSSARKNFSTTFGRTVGRPNKQTIPLDQALKQFDLAVNAPTPLGPKTRNLIDNGIYNTATELSLPTGVKTTVERDRIINNYGDAGQNLLDSLENFRLRTNSIKSDKVKDAVKAEALELQKTLIDDSVKGDSRKFLDLLSVDQRNGLEIGLPTKYEYKFLSLMNARRANDPQELKRLTDEITSGEYPAWEAISFIADDGFLSFKGMPGSPVKKVENNLSPLRADVFDVPLEVKNAIRRLGYQDIGRVSRESFLKDVNATVPAGYADLVMQLFDTRHARKVDFANSINKGSEAQKFNESFSLLKSARRDVEDALRRVAAIDPIRGTGYSPARIEASSDLMTAGKKIVEARKTGLFGGENKDAAQLLEEAREAVKKATVGPRPGAQLYEEGGAVNSGIAEFVPYMVR